MPTGKGVVLIQVFANASLPFDALAMGSHVAEMAIVFVKMNTIHPTTPTSAPPKFLRSGTVG